MARVQRAPAAHSGRFLLRVLPDLHGMLRAGAQRAGISLNEYCARLLAAPGPGLAGTADAAAIVSRAAALFGADLVGAIVFGSWARGDMGPASDVDVLVIVSPGVELTRALYRQWDAAPMRWGGREVDAHFTHLPEPGTTVAGTWGEAALDGVILFERDLAVSAALARVRRDIAAGRIVRRVVHGQPYWSLVA